MKKIFVLFALIFIFCSFAEIGAQEVKLINFVDHGVAAPLSVRRGAVATVDGSGRNVAVVWLFDHRGGYAILMIDALTGKSQQYPVPFPTDGDGPFASILSSRNKYYSHFNSYFVEFDICKRAFTFWRKTAAKTAMSMTEDDKGVIWSATYPNSGIVAYNPVNGQLKDYGYVYKQKWDQYPRWITTDNKGWVYIALGFASTQIIAFNPSMGGIRPMLAEAERKRGMAYVYRDIYGNVYGRAVEPAHNGWYPDGKASLKALEKETVGWYELRSGDRFNVWEHKVTQPKEIITGAQGLLHRVFPDGRSIEELDLVKRRLVIKGKGGSRKELHFDYTSEGGNVMTVSATSNGMIYGATTFPAMFFSYDPATRKRSFKECYGQWNTVLPLGKKIYVGGYPGGFLMEWDLSKPEQTNKNKAGWNPQYLGWANPIVNRPSKLLSSTDNKTIVMAGTPDYGLTGGGLVFWDTGSRKMQLIRDWEIIPNQSTNSMVMLQGGYVLGGTTIKAGTGGAKKARAPELYIMDSMSKKVLWHQALFPKFQEYTDLCQGPNGLIYGIVNTHQFFVFDPVNRKLIKQEDMGPKFGATVWQQGPRVLIPGPNKYVYVLFKKGIALIDPRSYAMTWLANSPVPITAGGVHHNGRIYFIGSSSHLYSYKLK